MNTRGRAAPPWRALGLAAGMAVAGCGNPDVGTIRADRGTKDKLDRANSDRPPPAPRPGSSRKGPDDNDRSSRAGGGTNP